MTQIIISKKTKISRFSKIIEEIVVKTEELLSKRQTTKEIKTTLKKYNQLN